MKLVHFKHAAASRIRIAVNPKHVAIVYEVNSETTDIHFSAEQTDTDNSGVMAWFRVEGSYDEVVAKLEGAQ